MTKDPLQCTYHLGLKDRAHFDWPSAEAVLEKVSEELLELKQSLHQGRLAQAHELGDLIFTIVQVARHLEINPSLALEVANQRYLERRSCMKNLAEEKNLNFETLQLSDLEQLWKEAKVVLKAEEIESLRAKFE